jgi:hypothetical protein
MGGVPASGVSAVVLGITVVSPGDVGTMTIYPTGKSLPVASSISFRPSENISNRVIVQVGSDGRISVSGEKATDLVIDVIGWFTDGSDPRAQGGLLNTVTPSRICDTRLGSNSCPQQSIADKGTLRLAVCGRAGVPVCAGATRPRAVVVNITVQSGFEGNLTVFRSGTPRPRTTDLTWQYGARQDRKGLTIAELCIVWPDDNGNVDLYVSGGPADFVVDTLGWYS